ncbi:MAG: pirin family protein [Pseudomonadota bacterium]
MLQTQTTAQQTLATPLLRRAEDRGHANHGWLRSAHTFSFASFYDPKWMGFAGLRVINDDEVAGGAGFPAHPHENFEIFSYVLEGALEHKDSMGNGSVVKAGGVQYMTAGTGVRHSEYNPSRDERVRFLQIWLEPKVQGAKPSYQTLDIKPEDKDGKLALFLSEDGRDGSITTIAGADAFAATLSGPQAISFDLRPGRKGWLQVAKGALSVNGVDLRRGDGLAFTDPGEIVMADGEDAEIILFDLEA